MSNIMLNDWLYPKQESLMNDFVQIYHQVWQVHIKDRKEVPASIGDGTASRVTAKKQFDLISKRMFE